MSICQKITIGKQQMKKKFSFVACFNGTEHHVLVLKVDSTITGQPWLHRYVSQKGWWDRRIEWKQFRRRRWGHSFISIQCCSRASSCVDVGQQG